MRTNNFFLACAVLLTLSSISFSQDIKILGKEKDNILDSLRKAGTPESDLAGYSTYLLNKKHNSHSHQPNQLYKTNGSTSCYNSDFELGNLTNWSGFTGKCCPITTTTPGIVLGRHTIMSGNGMDPYSQNTIPVVAPGGGKYSVRLGNNNIGSEAEKLVHKFVVSSQSLIFTYKYAVVLQDPLYDVASQPRFEVKMFDSTNALIPCGHNLVTTSGTNSGFVSVGDIKYKKWTTVGVDLSKYIGQAITIEFATGDCSYGGYFGYAYFDATCEPLKIKKKFCPGDLTATLIAPDGFSSYNWSTGHATQTITIANPHTGDTIWANLTSVTGCSTKLYAVLVQDSLIKNVKAWNDTLVCPGSKVQLHANGGLDYLWTSIPSNTQVSSDQNPFVMPLQTTTYVVTGFNACNALKDTVVVKVKPYVPLIASKDTVICKGNNTQLSVTGHTNCAWTPTIGLSCNTCTNPIASPLQTTTYYVSSVDALGGCLLKDSVKIRVDSSFVSVYAGSNKTICKGATVFLGATAIGAQHYSWSPKISLSCDTCLNVLANPTVTTVYTLTAKNKCVTSVSSVTITVSPLPIADAGLNDSICYGDVVTLHGTGGTLNTDYLWSPITALSCSSCPTPTLIATGNQTYYLSVHNAGGCYSNDSVKIVLKSKFHSITPDQTICEGKSVSLVAVNDSTKPLIWSPSINLSCATCASTIATPIITTTYVVIGTDTASCKGIDYVVINVINKPVADAGKDRDLCIGSYVHLPGTGGGTYSWSPVQNLSCTTCSNPQANPTVTTTYTLIVSNQCFQDTDEIKITVRPLPLINAGPDQSICQYYPTLISATGGLSYQWTPTVNLNCTSCPNPTVLTVPNAIDYIVHGTDKYTCVSSDTIKITTKPLPIINAGSDVGICTGNSTTFNPIGQLNNATWSPATALSCTSCPSPIASPTVTTVYSIVVTDPVNGCKSSDQLTVTVNNPPVALASPNQTICLGKGTNLIVSGGVSYSWTPSTGLSCTNCSNPIASPVQTTTYTVVATNGCGTDTKNVVVALYPSNPVNADIDKDICTGSSTSITATGGVTYTWSPALNLSCITCSSPIISTISSDITYTVNSTDIYGCLTSDAIFIKALPLPLINAGTDVSICIGSSITFNPSGQLNNVTWSPATALTCTNCVAPTASPTVTTTYSIKVIDPGNGCSNSDQIIVTVNKLPTAVVSANQTICEGLGTTLNAVGGTTYSWTPSTGLSCSNCNSPFASPVLTTTYSIIVIDINNCVSNPKQVIVTVSPNIPVNAGIDQKGCIGDPFVLNATGGNSGSSYSWLPTTGLSCITCVSPTLNATANITYSVTVVNSSTGCKSTDDVFIKIDSKPILSINTIYNLECKGLNVNFINKGTVANNYLWTFDDGITSTERDPIHNFTDPSVPHEVHIKVTNGNCFVESTMLTIAYDLSEQLYIPNVFTPNNDKINDCFIIDALSITSKKLLECGTITIFDRWGKKVFAGSLKDCWNGQIDNNGKEVSDGTYFYMIETTQKLHKGFVTLIK